MRNIKFRGKRFDTKEWIYGDLLDNSVISSGGIDVDNEYISIDEWCSIIPSTIGQYTGLKDCNGIEIYEGDIVEYSVGVMEDTGVVEWGNRHSGFLIKHSYIEYPTKSLKTKYYSIPTSNNVEVVGNIYEAGELNDNKNSKEN